MQDRFKFRAWDTEEGKYVSDDDICFDTSGSCDSIYDLLKHDDQFYVYEQCTGLKDKNGKLIYEGDIIDWRYGKYVVKWEFDDFVAMVGLSGVDNHSEIIGNIHENPELLEEK